MENTSQQSPFSNKIPVLRVHVLVGDLFVHNYEVTDFPVTDAQLSWVAGEANFCFHAKSFYG